MAGGSRSLGDAVPGNPVLQRERTLAVVLGASEWPYYPDFHSMASFRRSAHDIADYLRARSGLNLPPPNVRVLVDSFDDGPEILRQIRMFIRDRQEDFSKHGTRATDLFFYYVGHGGFTDDNERFFLSIRSTNKDDPLATSITAESLGRLIRDVATSLRTYLVLDCCFAASVCNVFMSSGPLGNAVPKLEYALPPQGDAAAIRDGKLPEYGTALLCASGSREPAKAPLNLPYTMFTGGMLEVLQQGDPDAPPWLSLDDMQRLVRARLSKQFADEAVLPQVHAPQQRRGRVDLVPLFRNMARHEMGVSRPPGPQMETSPEAGTLRSRWCRWRARVSGTFVSLSDSLQRRWPHWIGLRAMTGVLLIAVIITAVGLRQDIWGWIGILPPPTAQPSLDLAAHFTATIRVKNSSQTVSAEERKCTKTYGELFVQVANNILMGQDLQEAARKRVALALADVKDDERTAEFADVNDFSLLIQHFFKWGLITPFGQYYRLTEYGQKQYGILMK